MLKEVKKNNVNNKKNYILNNNKEFLNWYKSQIEKGYIPNLDLEQIQDLINKIIIYYNEKYSDIILDLKNGHNKVYNYNVWLKFKKNVNQNYLKALNCNYRFHYKYKIKDDRVFLWLFDRKNSNKRISIMADKNGFVTNYDINRFKDIITFDHKNVTLDELYYSLINNANERYDCTQLKKCIDFHDVDVELREKIFDNVVECLINSDKKVRSNGLFRAKNFLSDIRVEYNVNERSNIVNSNHQSENECANNMTLKIKTL